MKIQVVIFLCLFLACKANSDYVKHDKVSVYSKIDTSVLPQLIVSNGLEKEYSRLKWNLYCIYSDVQVLFTKESNISDSITFAFLDLKFEGLKSFNDTIEISMSFYYKDSIKCDINTVRNLRLASGGGFKKGNDSVIYYTSTNTMSRFWETGLESRFSNPMQPDVLSYIKNNSQVLHQTFKKLAEEQGVLP